VHHPMDEALAEIYAYYPDVHYACISEFQAEAMKLENASVIHHGIDPSLYKVQEKKQDYLAFLGRIAPVKGVHLAIEVAKKSGIPLKIAGQVQPLYQNYWENEVKPHVDGKFIEFLGELDIAEKGELLGNARAMVFPIQWHEPFGLVLVEAMACGTPVLALPGGSVAEIVREGVSGHICATVDEMVERAKDVKIPAARVRKYVDEEFSLPRMVDAYIALYQRLAGETRRPIEAVPAPESRIA
ncbi:MAG: glycosyltransferase, partial [Terriglobales bacterium]